MLPFTRDQFFAVFTSYNDAIWPLQIVAYLLGLVAILAIFWSGRTANRVVSGILAVMWLWTGVAYHGLFFAPINKAAYLFGLLFVVQGVFIAYVGLVGSRLRFGFHGEPAAWVGAIFVVYAAVAYPLVGLATGHTYPDMPMFGVTPCPVTIFTFGVMLMTTERFSRWLLVIPFIWSLIGGSAAILLNVPQDWLLLFSGVITIALILFRDRGSKQAAQPV
jgi:hypothetical protein